MKIYRYTCLVIFFFVVAPGLTQEAELQNFVMIEGRKYWVDRLEKTVLEKEGKYYIRYKEKFYQLEYKKDTPKSPYVTIFITLDDGSEHYPYAHYLARIQRAMGFEEHADRILEKGTAAYYVYPETKPYRIDSSSRSGKYTVKYHAVMATMDGRIISREEFKSYGGLYTFVKRISGGPEAMDTIIISPPLRVKLTPPERSGRGN